MKQKILFLIALMLSTLTASASDFFSGQFYYNITSSNTVAVVGNYYSTSDVVEIPSSVEHNGKTYTVTEIGKGAFSQNKITSVVIPNTVMVIGESAFIFCNNLKSIDIPNSVTEIEPDAFYYCENLESVNIPNSVTKIGRGAFIGCKSLTSVEIPNSVTEIGDYAFLVCNSLKAIYSKFSSADNRCLIINGTLHAFAPAGLTSYKLPNTITEIGRETFATFQNLESIEIPNSVTKIRFGAFHDCKNLTSVTIPNSVTSIEEYTFGACTKLKEITSLNTNPPTVNNTNAFDEVNKDNCILKVPAESVERYKTAEGWKDFKNYIGIEVEEDRNNVIYYTTTDGNIVTPGQMGGAKIVSNTYENGQGKIVFDSDVIEIGMYAFLNRSNLTSIKMPNSTTTIGNLAFFNCSNLTSIVIPNSVTKIDYSAFFGCTSMTSVSIGNSLSEIVDEAFGNCTSLTSVEIPNSVTKIGDGIFEGCINLKAFYGKFSSEDNRFLIVNGKLNSFAPAGLTSYSIPDYVTEIGNSAFWNCTSLSSVEIPNSVTNIECGAFSNSGLKSVKIPNSVTTIELEVFNSCSNLKSVEIPNSVTMIEQDAFRNCSSLTSVEIPNSVTAIGSYAFCNCSSLTSVEIPNSVTMIGEAVFVGCSSLKAFYGKFASDDHRCLIVDGTLNSFAPAGLTSYTIPNTITEIGYCAFGGCTNLLSIVIPNSVTYIGEIAFDYCTNLTEITSLNTTPPIVHGFVFAGVEKKTCVLRVPAESVEAYKNEEYWNVFNNIQAVADPIEITLYDSEEYTNSADMENCNISYVREFKNTALQPLYVPFEMSYEEWDAAGLVVYSILDFENNSSEEQDLEVRKMTSGTVEPNKPYLVKAKSKGEKTVIVRNKTLKAAETNEITRSLLGYTAHFIGNYTKMGDLNRQGLYVLSGGLLCTVDNPEAQLGAYRWYLNIPNANQNYSPRFRVVDDENSGINNITCEQRDSKVYTIDGQLMNTTALPRGLYIKNGKKFLVK